MPQLEKHNSCINTLAIIDFMRRHHLRVEDLLVGLEQELQGIQDKIAFLSEPNNWVSAGVVRHMFERAREVTGNHNVAYQIGFESVAHKKFGYIQRILIKALGTPAQALRRVKSLNEKFNRTKQVELVALGKSRARVRLRWNARLDLSKDFCKFNRGIYSAMFTIWGIKPAEISEGKCQFQGDEYCEFDIRWQELSLRQRWNLIMHRRSRLVTETLCELEQDKKLLEQKYGEIQALNQQLRRRVEELLTIQRASQSILTGTEYAEIMPSVLKLFIRSIGFSRGMVMLVDEQEGVLRYVHGVGDDSRYLDSLEGYRIPLDRRQNILARVASRGEPVIAMDAQKMGLNPSNLIVRNFRPKSFVILPLKAQGKVIGILAADLTQADGEVPTPKREFLDSFANQMALALENVKMYQELQAGSLRSIQALATAVEARDPYTRGHSERVAGMSVELGLRLGLPRPQLRQIRDLCLLHDIGKIGISDQILLKPTRLSEEEFGVIRSHPVIGQMIISPLQLQGEEVAIVRSHHERYDGRGYPDGLQGEQIPLSVRIATICDAFDAMTSDRPYRKALPVLKAMDELVGRSGRQFDPVLVEVFLEMIRQQEIDPASYESARLVEDKLSAS